MRHVRQASPDSRSKPSEAWHDVEKSAKWKAQAPVCVPQQDAVRRTMARCDEAHPIIAADLRESGARQPCERKSHLALVSVFLSCVCVACARVCQAVVHCPSNFAGAAHSSTPASQTCTGSGLSAEACEEDVACRSVGLCCYCLRAGRQAPRRGQRLLCAPPPTGIAVMPREESALQMLSTGDVWCMHSLA